MKKVLLVSVLLGNLIVGCSQETDKISFEQSIEMQELQETIKEQEQYIAELEKYKQEQENFDRQARQIEKQLEEEKYYIALSDITVISKNIDDSTSSPFDYGEAYWMTLVDNYNFEFTQYEKPNYNFSVPCSKIKSGSTFRMSDKDLDYFLIYGEYEEIVINEN